ncbi:MAG: hypothetical protein Q4D04_08905, partial [Clostridia bacterium]|nr:hypothetical protein [Clostridia bacterium]
EEEDGIIRDVDGTPVTKELADLMREFKVTPQEIHAVVGERGYFTATTPIAKYPAAFIRGCLVAGWKDVYAMVLKLRGSLPF